MDDKKRYFMGLFTISVVIGFSATAIYQYRKLNKQMEESTPAEEARKEVQEIEDKEINELYNSGETEGIREEMLEVGIEEYENPSPVTEEEKKMKYDPNSREAFDQYMRMMVAESNSWNVVRDQLLYLFTFPFTPTNQGDKLLRNSLIYNREEFFGPDSKWNERISWADVILHYSDQLVYNLDGPKTYWTEFILNNIGINTTMSSETIDQILESIANHQYYNPSTDRFGIFGLTDDELDAAYLIADDQVEPALTFEILFNEFLKNQ